MRRKPIRTILVANRGEIAVRVFRTCRELGIGAAAVFSEPDRHALHVRYADEAFPIGPAPAAQSYLNGSKIIEAARRCGADAIHPGYGFLSENAGFAEACAEAGIAFIGPPPEAIRAMGDKTMARATMQQAGVPVTPGSPAIAEDAAADEVAKRAAAIGFPVLVKAAAGGGGKGMRVARSGDDLLRSVAAAQSEARAAFGDGRIFLEKYIAAPRHVEFQVLADEAGRTVHLFERECSIQRRHQKVIEEAPSPALTPEARARMGEAAIEAARACGYANAGTIEFLVDADLNFYFMEMNTRLQVEHPVTEWIAGVDLVAEQIRIAEGEPLRLKQDDLRMRGHAIECRVYAEDPENDFLPDPGDLTRHVPPSGPGVRVDAGVESGDRVEMHYDPMISKLSTWAETRPEAIRRMARALDEYEVAGVRTTIPFCRYVMEHEAYRSGEFDTHFVARHFSGKLPAPDRDDLIEAAALAAALHHIDGPLASRTGGAAGPADPARGKGRGGEAGSRWIGRREYR